ncbi:MAG: hypothetical protein IPH10_08545 [bacterium]|nr:hypothetical protein [bacterium]
MILINTARGGVIDERAVGRAGPVTCTAQAFDVWVSRPKPRRDLVEHPKVVALPHVGRRPLRGKAASAKSPIF